MPGTTPCRNYPYAIDSDPIDVAGDIQALAEAIDTDICVLRGSAQAAAPIGSGMLYFGHAPPATWLFCRGQQLSRTAYAALFAVIGTAYGAGDGVLTFNLPNLQGTIPVGYNAGTNVPSNVGARWTGGIGQQFGWADATLVAHAHGMTDHTHDLRLHYHFVTGNTSTGSQNHTHPTATTGGSLEAATAPPAVNGLASGAFQMYIENYETGANGADHVHGVAINSGTPNIDTTGPSTPHDTTVSGTLGTVGGGHNYPPGLGVNFLIKVQ